MQIGDTIWRIPLAFRANVQADHHLQRTTPRAHFRTDARAEEAVMNALLLLVLAILVVAPRMARADDAKPLNLQLKPKLLSASVAPAAPAPFANPVEEGHPLDFSPAASQHESSRSACAVDSTWCYDMGDGGRTLVYKPARQFMPHFNGLTAENISLKRDRIVFRYSFR
jgi:hypothetical protein